MFAILLFVGVISEISSITRTEIDRLITHGQWSNIIIPDGSLRQYIIFNPAKPKYDLHVKLYQIWVPCRSAQLFVEFKDIDGSPERIGPFCDLIELLPVVSHKGNVKLIFNGYLPQAINVNSYKKLVKNNGLVPKITQKPTTHTKGPTIKATTIPILTTKATSPTTTSKTVTIKKTPTKPTTTLTTSTSTTATAEPTKPLPPTRSAICGGELTANRGVVEFVQPSNSDQPCVKCNLKIKIPEEQQVTKLTFKSFRFDVKKFNCVDSVITIKVNDVVVGMYCSFVKPNIDEEIIVKSGEIDIDISIKWDNFEDHHSGFDLSFEPFENKK